MISGYMMQSNLIGLVRCGCNNERMTFMRFLLDIHDFKVMFLEEAIPQDVIEEGASGGV